MPTIEMPEFVSQVAGPNPKYADHDAFVDDLMKTPLFMKTMPSERDIEENETLAAIHSLIYDGTPVEIATNFKNQGNEAFQEGKRGFKHAINYYTKGLDQKADDPKLNAILHTNRAAVNLELGNFRKVLNDCAAALTLQPDNVKAYYRSVKALLALDKLDEALDCCERALKVDPHNAAIQVEQAKVVKRQALMAETARARAEREERTIREARELKNAIVSRGITMITTNPSAPATTTSSHFVHPSQGTHSMRLDHSTDSPTLTVPTVFLYPEHAQSDLIAAFPETDSFQPHLDTMFEQPAPWDDKREYTPETCEIYFEARNAADGAVRLMRVGSHLTLGSVLAHKDYRVVDGVATFYIVVKGSAFAKSFRKRYKTPTVA
ncbi:Tetratricopeptide repeat protein 4 [Geranomyces variabilis]|nr:Tetratricopeptide repeat protein 4 [Geranomyces variabilis]